MKYIIRLDTLTATGVGVWRSVCEEAQKNKGVSACSFSGRS